MEEFNPVVEIGIRYRKIQIDDNRFVLIPIALEKGCSIDKEFLSREIFKIATSIETIDVEEELIDDIISLEELQLKYDMFDEEDLEFLCNYYYEEGKSNIIIIEIDGEEMHKRKINLPAIESLQSREVYERQLDIPSVVLNETALRRMLELNNIEKIKEELNRYKNLLETYLDQERDYAISRIEVTNSKITEIDTNAVIINPVETHAKKETKEETQALVAPTAISLTDLENYVNARVLGQETGVRRVCQTLYMNITAAENEDLRHMLIVGPTGTGKTETLRTIAKYLKVPFKDVNTPNLVPQGIVGPQLEDQLYSLIVQANGDVEKASRGIIAFDEFDKFGKDSSEQKQTVREILLKFIEGDVMTFERNKKTYTMDTSHITKIFSGSFSDIYEKKHDIGFGAQSRDFAKDISSSEAKDQIESHGYFGIELLDRIKVPIVYHDLDYETKREILLKLSEYAKRIKRYERQFGITLEADESFIEAIFEVLNKKRDSVRILNNVIEETLCEAEHELIVRKAEGLKKLTLTRKTIENAFNFTLE